MLRRSCVWLNAAAQAAKDPFSVLGLRRSASRDDVKKAYRELAKEHHPDSGTGDPVKMEAVNRAYNLLIKENAYDELHQPAPPEGEAPPGAAGPDDFQRIVFDRQRLANLDAKTERVTPEGKFMYADRETGEWVTVDRPISRPEQPRYASHGKFRRETDLFAEIRQKQEDVAQRERNKSRFQRYVTDRVSKAVPFHHPVLVSLAIAIYFTACYIIYERALGKRDCLTNRWDYYGEVRDHRHKVRDVYPVFADECDTLAAAAAITFLAAANKTSPTAPQTGPLATDMDARAPYHLYLLYNAM